MFKHILLPTDGSETALRAVRSGVELALQVGAHVTVMTALEHFPAGIMASGYRPPEDPDEEPGLQSALQRLGAAEDILLKSGVSYQRKLVRDKPVYQAIVDAARESGADLIVMGTRGMGLMERLLVGSQTQRVLTHTNIPVLTMH
jgi:nucleotide-binding universal stress UspA family protein